MNWNYKYSVIRSVLRNKYTEHKDIDTDSGINRCFAIKIVNCNFCSVQPSFVRTFFIMPFNFYNICVSQSAYKKTNSYLLIPVLPDF